MMLLEDPSPWASLTEWEAWRIRLEELDSRDSSVIAAKQSADEMIAFLRKDEEIWAKIRIDWQMVAGLESNH